MNIILEKKLWSRILEYNTYRTHPAKSRELAGIRKVISFRSMYRNCTYRYRKIHWERFMKPQHKYQKTSYQRRTTNYITAEANTSHWTPVNFLKMQNKTAVRYYEWTEDHSDARTLLRCKNHIKLYMVYSVAQEGGVSSLHSMKYLTTSLQLTI